MRVVVEALVRVGDADLPEELDDAPPRDTFGKREVAILRLIAGGYSNKEIARSLFLAEGTVKNYVSDILVKLDARDRTRAVLKAITLRII